DLEKVEGKVTLRFAKEGEKFTPLGALEVQETNEGEVVYADEQKILCRKWNYRDCEEAKIAEYTKKFVLVVDGAMDISGEQVENATNDLALTLEKFVDGCKARISFVKT
ncbi:MAG: phenylalanine--tRNA ligase beta subunit-related protein, partial [Candidatus Micrarchaeota archaeon]